VYKDLAKKHHVLKRAKNCEFCHAKRFPGEGLAFCCRKGKVNIYIPEMLNYAACLPVRATGMQNIFGSTFGILTVTSHPQALEFPVIIIS
jgi:hypothetical protein